MKTISTLCLSVGLALQPLFSFGSAAQEGDNEMTSFFAQRLKGDETTTFGKQKTVKTKDIKQWQDRVWKAWVEAQAGSSEEKLDSLSPLGPNTASQWNMPAGTEPVTQMPYYWGFKGSNRPENGYPLFLYIHGSGPRDYEWATGLKLAFYFDDAPSAYFIPQIPSEGEYYRWWQKGKQHVWERLFRQTMASGKIDPNRLYCFGISEGGYGSQRLASYYADYLAAAGPMAGGEPLKNAPAENCANIGFSFLTGAEDYGFYRNTLTTYTKQAFDSLQTVHPDCYRHRIELIPGMGHHIDYRLTTPWLKTFVRNPYPKYVYWEDFPMDGRYRSGFYNLAVVERPYKDEAESRTRYEMTIDDNTVNLQIDKVTYKTVQTDPQFGIEMKFSKTFQPATGGKLLVYLCPQLVDLNKKVTIKVNGKQVFYGKVKADVKHMVNSCATYFDPCRIYPAAVEVAF